MGASFLTATARLGADPAVLHAVLGVLSTLLAAGPTGSDAGLKLGRDHIPIGFGLPRDNVACRGADIGAIQVEPDAAHQHLHLLLTQAGVGAHLAGTGAVVAGFNALLKQGHIDLRLSGMGLEHGRRVWHWATWSFLMRVRSDDSGGLRLTYDRVS